MVDYLTRLIFVSSKWSQPAAVHLWHQQPPGVSQHFHWFVIAQRKVGKHHFVLLWSSSPSSCTCCQTLVIKLNQPIQNCCRLHGWVDANASQVWLFWPSKYPLTCIPKVKKNSNWFVRKLKTDWSSESLQSFKHLDFSPFQEPLNFNSSWTILETHLVLEFPMQWLHPWVLGAEDLGLSSCLPPRDVGKIHLFSINFFKQREVMKYLFLGFWRED